jgi:hypothetical protein
MNKAMKMAVTIVNLVLVATMLAGMSSTKAHGVSDQKPGYRLPMIHCEHDEVIERPHPCVWDGRHDGNGEGKSLIIKRDATVIVIKHRRAHRIGAY